jgi:hypothetical protein
MPICNEDVARVYAGLRATYESLERTGQIAHFDFFILSDSGEADICAAEAPHGTACAARPAASDASSIGTAVAASSARAATWTTSAAAGAPTTATWWCWTPTAS